MKIWAIAFWPTKFASGKRNCSQNEQSPKPPTKKFYSGGNTLFKQAAFVNITAFISLLVLTFLNTIGDVLSSFSGIVRSWYVWSSGYICQRSKRIDMMNTSIFAVSTEGTLLWASAAVYILLEYAR